jgi:hypothetical protein
MLSMCFQLAVPSTCTSDIASPDLSGIKEGLSQRAVCNCHGILLAEDVAAAISILQCHKTDVVTSQDVTGGAFNIVEASSIA